LNFQHPARSRTTRSPCASRHAHDLARAQYSGHAPSPDALGVKQEFEKALAPDGKPAK
jgi:hypothetical protein